MEFGAIETLMLMFISFGVGSLYVAVLKEDEDESINRNESQ
ncbi:hypothetical protein [Psychrobacillus sp.]|nr:hypothetical protein [Psychrobacillus sp.]